MKTPVFPTYHTVFLAVNEPKLAKMGEERKLLEVVIESNGRLGKLVLLLCGRIFLKSLKERPDHKKHNESKRKGRKDSASLKTPEAT